MLLLRIAYRNLQRSPARTVISVVAIAAAVLSVLLLKGTVDGILETMEDSTVRLAAGHVRVIDREYRTRERLLSLLYPVDGFADDGEPGLEPMLDAFRRLEPVTDVVPRLRFGGLASRGDDVRTVLVVAGDPAIEARILRTERYLGEGRFVRPGRREAVLGRRLLNRLGMDVGDRFTLVFSSAFGALRGYTFEVVGAFESSLTYLDDGTVFIPLDVAQEATDMDDAVTEVLLMTRRRDDTPALLAAVDELLTRRDPEGRYMTVPWYQHSVLIEWMQVGRALYDLIYALVLGLASLVIVNTLMMVVHERRQEIGLLGALGLRPGQIRALFLLEGALCGIFGSVAGAVLGMPLLWVLSRTGIPLPGVEAMGADLMYPTTIYPVFEPGVIAYGALGGLLVTVLAAYFPARHAAALRPTEALRP